MRGLLQRAPGPLFVVAGLLHFARPRVYEAIMPDYLPWHRQLVYASGAAESAGGALLAARDPRLRRAGMWSLLATLAAILPANVHMAQHADRYPAVPGGRATLIARLPLQLVLARWVVAAARRGA
jgi:uncharacterized membrane protein